MERAGTCGLAAKDHPIVEKRQDAKSTKENGAAAVAAAAPTNEPIKKRC